MLQAGDADMDLDFDQLDLVQVQIAAKYLSAQSATWGEGDWDGAPGGVPGNLPPGNGLFDQFDIVAGNGELDASALRTLVTSAHSLSLSVSFPISFKAQIYLYRLLPCLLPFGAPGKREKLCVSS